MSRVADIIRRDMFNIACPPYNGTLIEDCHHKSVPLLILTLIAIIIHGTNMKKKRKIILNHKQLYPFHSVKQIPNKAQIVNLFIGAYVHSKIRSIWHG